MDGRSKVLNLFDDAKLKSLGLKPPDITVIVTNFNYEKYIIPCLKSVAGQTYHRYKCIIVDDNSTDRSKELIENFIRSEEAQGKFQLVCHEINLGQMAAFKTGLKHADGIFVVFLDADDMLLEDFLIFHIQIHLNFGYVAFTSSNQLQINEDNQIIAGTHSDLETYGKLKYVGPFPIFKNKWRWATTSSMMFRRSILQLIIPDDCEPFRICADNYLCLFANLLGGSLLIPQVYGCYRRHGVNYFSKNPIIGGRLPTGDMTYHPTHDTVREHILSHFLEHRKEFLALLSKGNFINTLLSMVNHREIQYIRKKYPDCLPGNQLYLFFSLSYRSFLFHIKYILKNFLRYFIQKQQKPTDYETGLRSYLKQ